MDMPPADASKSNKILFLETSRYIVAPGQKTIIPVKINNPGKKEDFLELSLGGIPQNWFSIATPVARLLPRGSQVVEVAIQPPRDPQARLGKYTLTFQVSSQVNPGKKEQAEVSLLLGTFTGRGSLGLLIGSTQYPITPGDRADIPLFLVNRSAADDTLRLSVEGLPAEWVTFSSPEVGLATGGQKGVTLTIQIPKAWQSRAGRHIFSLQAASLVHPDHYVTVQCTLTVASYTQFRCLVKPPRVEAGQPAQVVVSNQGNVPQTYAVTWQSAGDALAFSPQASQELRVEPGQVAAVEFTADPRQKPWLGDQVFFPYQIQVEPKDRGLTHGGQSAQTIQGQVTCKGVLPVWALPVGVLVCLMLVMVPLVAVFIDRLPAQRGTPAALLTQTAAVAQTAVANQTAVAAAGKQDTDGDGLNNLQEAQLGSNPSNPDTDADSLLDGAEVISFATDPTNPDTDADSISDGEEIRIGTLPTISDTDRDNLPDGDELRRGSDPKNPDSDGDGITDGDEVSRGMDPNNPDSDGDTLPDGDELRIGTNPLQQDSDNDRLTDGNEVRIATNPLNPDTDGDGIIDGIDTDPLNPNNPSLTATSIARIPTTTPVLPTAIPTQTPTLFPTFVVPTTPAPIPPTGTIVFVSDRDGNPEIYTSNVTTGAVQRLTDDAAADTQPALSADQGRIAFTSNRAGNNDIYVMNSNGSNPVNLTNHPADDQDPAWSPDGQWLTFASNRDGNWEIYAMRSDGSSLRNLTHTLSNEYQPFWYSERQLIVANEKIAFTTDRDGNEEIYSMSIDGFNQTNLTNRPGNDSLPAVSPYGDRIAFVTNRDGNQEVYVMSTNGSNQFNLSVNPSQDTQPTWSPDSRWVGFTTDRAANLEIYLMSSSGTDASNYSRSPSGESHPSWR